MNYIAAFLLILIQSLPLGSRPITTGGGGVTVVQSSVSSASGTWTTTITPTAAGHLLSGTALVGSSGGCATSPTVSDTAGNTWFIDKTLNDSAGTGFQFAAFHAISNGTTATTLTITHGVCVDGSVSVAEVSGLASNALDLANSASSAPASAPTVTLSPISVGDFCSFQGNLVSQPGGFTPSSFTTMQFMQTGVGGGELGNDMFMSGLSTATSLTITSTASYGLWILIGACYK